MKILKAEAEIEKHKEMKEQKLKEEDDRHAATKEALAAIYDLFVSNGEKAVQKHGKGSTLPFVAAGVKGLRELIDDWLLQFSVGRFSG